MTWSMTVTGTASVFVSGVLAIGDLLLGCVACLELLEFFRFGDDVEQDGVQLLVAVELANEVVEAAARREKLAQTFYLLDQVGGGKVFDGLKAECDRKRGGILVDVICDGDGGCWRKGLH